MKRLIYISGIVMCLMGFGAKAQITVVNHFNCLADTLVATLTGLTPTTSGITGDDYWSSVFPIGFTYNFYGIPYTQCIIGSNGCLGFNTGSALSYNTWPIGATLATTASTDIRNVICGPWCDVLVSMGGTIMYSTVGTSPNRKFEVTWCGTAMFGCTSEWLTTQIIIYETTGIAEVHLGHRTICSTGWNQSEAIIGVKNSAGTVSTVAPGRDYTPLTTVPPLWVATNEAWRFTPSGTTYTVASIPYAPIPYASSTVYWYDSLTHTYLGSGLSLIVTPTVTTTYEACAVGCNDTSKAFITLGPVGTGGTGGGGLPHITSATFTNPTDCGLSDGTITLHGVRPHQIDTIFETKDGIPQPVWVDSAALDSTIVITGLGVGTYTIYVKVGPCPSNTITVTLTTPVLAISGESFTNPTLCGKCDGSIIFRGLWPGRTATINYNFDGVPRTFSGVVAPDSTLTMSNLCIHYPLSNFTSIVASIGLCTAPGTDITLTSPTLNDYGVSPSMCGNKDGFIRIYNLPADSTATVTYFGGLGSPASLTVAGDDTLTIPYLSGGVYTSIIAKINIANCPAPDVTLTNPPIFATFTDPTICGKNDGTIKLFLLPADSTFNVTFTGPGAGSGLPYTVAGDDTLTIPGLIAGTSSYSSIIAIINGVQCPLTGSITLTDPPVHASFTDEIKLGCRGDEVTFTSNSTPSGFHNNWTFGDGSPISSTDNTNITHLYNDYPSYTGTYTVTLVYQTYAPGCKDSTSIVVNFNHSMAAAFTPMDTTVCLVPESPITFLNQSYGNTLTYSWDFGDGSTSADFEPFHNYKVGGVFQTRLTVTDNLGCDSTVYGKVDVIKINIKTVTHDTTVCLVEPMEMIAHPDYIPGTFTSINYLWTPDSSLKLYDDTITYFYAVGDYIYTITATTTPLGCVAMDTETIHSKPPIKLTHLTETHIIPYGSSIQLNADSADYYYWMPDDGTLNNRNINNPIASPKDSTTYTVVGMSIYGCKDTETIVILVDPAQPLGVPTGFTPNGDGQNDKFKLSLYRFQKLVEFKIFNRWGLEVYHTTNPEDGWDGTYNGAPQDIGTYNYVMILASPDGTNKAYTGTVTLLR